MHCDRRSRAVASLHGLAVGDALGSCFFGAGNLLVERRTLPADPWRWTDDTEMACSVFAVLDRFGRVDRDALAASFAAHFDVCRDYGPGVSRMLSLVREEGGDWRKLAAESWGGRGSWGNGAAMRVAPLGAYFADDVDRVVVEGAASAEVTHTHEEGVAGAIAVAVAAALVASLPGISGAELLDEVAGRTPGGLVRDGIGAAVDLLGIEDSRDVAALLGNGEHLSAPDTVPFCSWVVAKDYRSYCDAFWATAQVGGDVDTMCAIVGGIEAARRGVEAIPAEWLRRCEPLPQWAGIGGSGGDGLVPVEDAP